MSRESATQTARTVFVTHRGALTHIHTRTHTHTHTAGPQRLLCSPGCQYGPAAVSKAPALQAATPGAWRIPCDPPGAGFPQNALVSLAEALLRLLRSAQTGSFRSSRTKHIHLMFEKLTLRETKDGAVGAKSTGAVGADVRRRGSALPASPGHRADHPPEAGVQQRCVSGRDAGQGSEDARKEGACGL